MAIFWSLIQANGVGSEDDGVCDYVHTAFGAANNNNTAHKVIYEESRWAVVFTLPKEEMIKPFAPVESSESTGEQRKA